MNEIEEIAQKLEKKQKKVRPKDEPVPKSAEEWVKKSYDKGRGDFIGGIGSEAL
jgi:hypothetical protein